jgi:hypothetical protein
MGVKLRDVPPSGLTFFRRKPGRAVSPDFEVGRVFVAH